MPHPVASATPFFPVIASWSCVFNACIAFHLQVSRIRPRASSTRSFGKARGRKDPPATDVSAIDFGRKVLHFAWHPKNYCVAVAGLNNLYIYNA